MANITIRRKTGASTYEVLYPSTTIAQVSGLQTALDAKIASTEKGAANGVATLDASGLIPASQLSAYIRGGVRLQGIMSQAANDTIGELIGILETTVTSSTGAVSREELIGYAFIASAGFTLNEGTLPANTAYTINPGDEGDTTAPITVEIGDILLVSNYSLVSTTHTYTLAFLNNTYGAATTSVPGIVQLLTTTAGSGGAGGTLVQDIGGSSNAVRGIDILNLTDFTQDQNGRTTGFLVSSGHTHSQYQPVDPTLTALAGVTTSANKLIYASGTDTFTTTDLTAFGRTLIDDADNTAARSTLGLVIGTNVQAYDAGLQSIAGLTTAADNLIYTTALDTYATTSLTSFGRSLIDDADNTAARSTLGVVIGTNVQAYDAGLQSIAGLTTAADKMIYTTGSDTYAVTDLTSFGRSLLDDADNTAARSTLGVVIGTNVQAYSANLAAIAGLAVTDSNIIVGNGTTWVAESGATARTSLGVYSTSEVDTAISNKPNIYYDLDKTTADSTAPVGAYIFDDLATSNGW